MKTRLSVVLSENELNISITSQLDFRGCQAAF